MLLNFIILAAIIFLAYWWALQGFFSGFLHLMAVIIAGALAFAAWEPLARVLLPMMYANGAWGICLMGPFLAFWLLVRIVLDRFAKSDVRIHTMIDYIGGGICGVCTGCLAAGMTVISVGFLPLGPDILGYEPYIVTADGRVADNPSGHSLWIPVDTTTGALFSALSSGAFSSSTPMESYQPEIARQSALYRRGFDPNSSMVVVPGSVTVDDCFDTETPVNYLADETVTAALKKAAGDEVVTGEHRLVAVATTWKSEPKGTYDLDVALRIFAPQIQLVSFAEPDHPEQTAAELEIPVGFSREDFETHAHTFTPVTSAIWPSYFYNTSQTNKITWVFVIPSGRYPKFLLARHTRLEIDQIKKDDRIAMKDSVGTLPGSAAPGPAPESTPTKAPEADANASNVGPRSGRHAGTTALNIQVSAELPNIVSQNMAAAFTIEKQGISSGDGTIQASDSVSRELMVNHINMTGGRLAVRVEVDKDRAESLLGAAFATAAELAAVYVQDKNGDKFYVVAYALMKSADRSMEVHVDLDNPLTSSKILPVKTMSKGDKLYLYFAIPKGEHLTAFNVGQGTQQEIDPPLAVNAESK